MLHIIGAARWLPSPSSSSAYLHAGYSYTPSILHPGQFHYAISIVHFVIACVMLISTSPLPQISIYFALKLFTHPPSYARSPPRRKIQCQQDVSSAVREREADQSLFELLLPYSANSFSGSNEHLYLHPLQVRCDRKTPTCHNCDRLGVNCPGYSDAAAILSHKDGSRKRIQDSVDTIYRASGVEKRKVGSCDECRRTKSRCSRTRPTCKRCVRKGFACKYNAKYDAKYDAAASQSPSSSMPVDDQLLTTSNRSGSVSTPGSQANLMAVSLSAQFPPSVQWYV